MNDVELLDVARKLHDRCVSVGLVKPGVSFEYLETADKQKWMILAETVESLAEGIAIRYNKAVPSKTVLQ